MQVSKLLATSQRQKQDQAVAAEAEASKAAASIGEEAENVVNKEEARSGRVT